MTPILYATLSVAIIGLLIGFMLVKVGKKFAVEVNEKEAAVRNCLPGNNCGGCGYAGCDALAAAIAEGIASVDSCPVGGAPVAEQIGQIMGVEADPAGKKVAYVKCAGDCEHALQKANYIGVGDCNAAVNAGVGSKACNFGCLGLGSCVKACPFDAIHIINGVARVDRNTCKACGKCVIACPKHLIELIPDSAQYMVQCSSTDKGAAVKKACSTGCIGCSLCVKQCENEAIAVTNFLSAIDPLKCVGCGKCAEKCPVNVIEKRYLDAV